MKAKLGPVYLLAFAGLAAVVTGCSSGGVGGPVASGTDSASGQVACALFIQQWGQILWGLVTSQTGGQKPTIGEPFQHYDPDTGEPDYIALEITFPDGSWQLIKQLREVYEGPTTTLDYEITSSAGLTVNYTAVVDDTGALPGYTMADDTTQLDGTSVLPDGKTQEFEAFSAMEPPKYMHGATTLESRQSDGSTFTMNIPLSARADFGPDFSATTTGTYTSPDFNIQYELDSTTAFPTRWATLSANLQGGLTGRFSLGADFSGSGRLLEDAQPLALLSWTPTGKTKVSFLSAGSGAASPAGAAVDYLTYRWLTLQAAGPAPGVSGLTGYLKLPL